MMTKAPLGFVEFCYRNYVTLAFVRDIPKTWNIKPRTWYHCLIKNCDEKTLSVVFFDEANQLIETLIPYTDLNTGQIFVKVPMEV